jgi:hypothetical protein
MDGRWMGVIRDGDGDGWQERERRGERERKPKLGSEGGRESLGGWAGEETLNMKSDLFGPDSWVRGLKVLERESTGVKLTVTSQNAPEAVQSRSGLLAIRRGRTPSLVRRGTWTGVEGEGGKGEGGEWNGGMVELGGWNGLEWWNGGMWSGLDCGLGGCLGVACRLSGTSGWKEWRSGRVEESERVP